MKQVLGHFIEWAVTTNYPGLSFYQMTELSLLQTESMRRSKTDMMAGTLKFAFSRRENNVGKKEKKKAAYQHFLLFHSVFISLLAQEY